MSSEKIESAFKEVILLLKSDIEETMIRPNLTEWDRGVITGQKIALSYLKAALKIEKEGVNPVFEEAVQRHRDNPELAKETLRKLTSGKIKDPEC